jgi:L-threonylcarbamoyladenylate synthase
VFSDLGRKGAEPVLTADGTVVDEVGMLGCILDAGSCDVGVESTVVDGTQWSAAPNGTRLLKVLRPGGVGVEQIEKVVAALDAKFGFVGEQRTTVWVYGRDSPIEASRPTTPSTTIRSPLPQRRQAASSTPEIHNPSTPGMKYKHYSPSIPVYLLYPNDKFPVNPLQGQTALAPDKPEQVWKHIADQLVSARADNPKTNESSAKKTLRFGVMAFDDSSLRRVVQVQYAGETTEIKTEIKSLGHTEEDAARALFRDMLAFEATPAVALDAEAASIQQEGESTLADTNGSPSSITSAQGVDAILIEACLEKGVGLAVMERVNKAVGGGGSKGLGVNSASGSQKRFWVDVSP